MKIILSISILLLTSILPPVDNLEYCEKCEHYHYVKDDRFTSVTDFKQWLSEHPVEVYYQLETPTTINLKPSGELKTYKDYTSISNNEDTEMQVKYYIKE